MESGSEAVSESAVAAAREVRVVVGRLRRRLREVSGLAGLTPSQTAVLSRLSKDGACSASDLAAAERVRPQSMAATLAVLGAQGLVVRAPDPADGRRQLVSLSAAGVERVEGGRVAREEWLAREFQDRFTEAERRSVVAALVLLDRLS